MIEQLRGYCETALTSPTIVTLGVLVASFAIARVLARILRAVLVRMTRKTRNAWDDRLADTLAGPLSTCVVLIAFTWLLPWLPVATSAVGVLHDVAAIATIVAVVWGAFRCVDLARAAIESQPWARARPASRSLLRLGGRFAKVTVAAFGLLIALGQLGVSVASLIAGLGIGGLVLALAAQKTVENLFGTVSIGIDQPMREGDFVKIGDTLGTVEQIGLRSSRIRTLDRTVVTIPNGELSNQRVESFAARDRTRLTCTIGLVYETTPAQLRQVLAALEQILRDHPRIWKEAVVVRFVQFNESSLDIDVMAWFQTSDWNEFQTFRQDVLIAFMEAIEAAGTSMAFPTRTIHVAPRDRTEARE